MSYDIPSHMKAIRYNKPKDFELVQVPVPTPKAHEILIKVKSCGICGTDISIHDGGFMARMPVITGHEISGIIVKIGADVTGFEVGEKVTADNLEYCGLCYFCHQGKKLLCENFSAYGVHLNGGFAEYCTFSATKLFRFTTCSWTEATLFEAMACAVHGLDRIRAPVGSTILILGAGPSGLCLAQLLKCNSGVRVVIASNVGPKMELAKKLNAADEYVEFDRQNPEPQWEELKKKFQYGFDVVVEATGSHEVLEKALMCCSRGGMLVLYGVYKNEATIKLSPSRVFFDELTIIGSFAQLWSFPRAVSYLESRKVDVRGIVTHTFTLEEFGEALDAVRQKKCIKAAILMD